MLECRRRLPYPARLCLFLGAVTLCAAVAAAALASATGRLGLPYPLYVLDQRIPGLFRLHMTADAVGLALLPWTMLLRKRRGIHRILGRLTAALLLLGSCAALPCAIASLTSPAARLGLFVQGLLCLVFLLRALYAIRANNVGGHARNMLRMSAVIGGAIVLRLLLFASQKAGLPFGATYAVAAWASWGLPLLAVLLWQGGRSPASQDLLSCLASAAGR